MKKSRTVIRRRQSSSPALRHLPLVDILVNTQTERQALVVASGLKVLEAMVEEDRVAVCGPRYAHQPERRASRAGHAPSEVVLGGRKVALRRPRVRHAGQEVALPTCRAFAGDDSLNRPSDRGLRRTSDRARQAPTRDHPVPEALPRPRDLPTCHDRFPHAPTGHAGRERARGPPRNTRPSDSRSSPDSRPPGPDRSPPAIRRRTTRRAASRRSRFGPPRRRGPTHQDAPDDDERGKTHRAFLWLYPSFPNSVST